MDVANLGVIGFTVVLAEMNTTASSVTTVAGGGVNSVGTNPGGGPGGSFDFRYVLGGGSDKLKTAETISWDAFGLGSSLPINGDLALHVQGTSFSPNSAWYVSPVPEPETYAMMLIGLFLIGFSIRKQKVR